MLSFQLQYIELDGQFGQEVVVRRTTGFVALQPAVQDFDRMRVLFNFVEQLFDR